MCSLATSIFFVYSARFLCVLSDQKLLTAKFAKIAKKSGNLESKILESGPPFQTRLSCSAEMPAVRAGKTSGKKGKKFSLLDRRRVNAFPLRKGGNQALKLT